MVGRTGEITGGGPQPTYIDASFALNAPKYNMTSLLPGIWSNLHLAETTF